MDVHANQASVEYVSNRLIVDSAVKLCRMPQTILKHAEQSSQELIRLIEDSIDSNDSVRSIRNFPAGSPLLKPPKNVANSEDAEVRNFKRNALLTSVASLLEKASLSRLAVNAHTALINEVLRNQSNVELLEKYEVSISLVKSGLDKLAELRTQLNLLNTNVNGYQEKLGCAEIQMNETFEGNPKKLKQEKIEKLKSEIQKTHNDITILQNKSDLIFNQIVQKNIIYPSNLIQSDTSNIARLLELMSTMGDLILKVGDERSEIQRNILKIQESLRFEKMLKDAEKADRETAKAEEMNKTMGCVGKILGGLTAVFSLLGAFFTGGATIAIAVAAIGMFLMVVDEIYQSVSGESFIQQALQPLTKLLQPLMQLIMSKLADVLRSFGLDNQTAKMISMIVISLVIAAVAVALIVTGVGNTIVNIASKVLDKITTVISKMLEKTLGALVPEFLKKNAILAATKISTATSKMFDAAMERLGLLTDTASRQIYGSNLGLVSVGVNLGKTVVTGGLEVSESFSETEIAKIHADIKFNISELELLKIMIKSLLEYLEKSFYSSQDFFRMASNSIANYRSVGIDVARSIGDSRSI